MARLHLYRYLNNSIPDMKNSAQRPIFCKPCFYPVSTHAGIAAISKAVAQKRFPAVLGANASVAGWSIFAAEPTEIFSFCLGDDHPFEKLQCLLSKYQCCPSAKPFAAGVFCGGWIGYFGYELNRFIERLPARSRDDLDIPIIQLGFYDKAILYNHNTARVFLLALDCQRPPQQPVEQKIEVLKRWLCEAEKISVCRPDAESMKSVSAFTANMSRSYYMKALEQIQHYIKDGHTYQINFSQRFETEFFACPWDLFHWQNSCNPNPYAAYLTLDDGAIVCASPELFIKVCGQTIITKPVKGTRPRNLCLPDQTGENQRYCDELLNSDKDKAELAMIVDLERNDLARICRPGTRRVICPRAIEAFPTVYHTSAVIEGRLASKPDPRRLNEILKAVFPGGSITGAPKIRSMEIIDQLEPTGRGIYTGSIGWIGINYDMCLNIAIRTILVHRQKAYVYAGGGIVADSIPQTEWEETLTKAEALLAGINAVAGMSKQHVHF